MTLPKDYNDSSSKREVSDFPEGEKAATITYYGGMAPKVRWHEVLRTTRTQVITASASGEIRWSRGKWEHDFHEVGTRGDSWVDSPTLYAPGDFHIAQAITARREFEVRQERARKIQEVIAPLVPSRGNYGLASTTDKTLREVIAGLTALLPD